MTISQTKPTRMTRLAPKRSTMAPINGDISAAVNVTAMSAANAALCDQPVSSRIGPTKMLNVEAPSVAMPQARPTVAANTMRQPSKRCSVMADPPTANEYHCNALVDSCLLE